MLATSGIKFVLSSIGSQGDLLPILGLAKALVERGQRCLMLGGSAVAARAAALGVDYCAVAPVQTDNLVHWQEMFDRDIAPSYAPTFRAFQHELQQGHDLVVVNRTNYSATTLMCELYGLPLVRILLAPFEIRSCVEPPMPLRVPARGKLGTAFKRYQLPKIYDAIERDPHALKGINAQRAALGLTPISSLRQHEALVDHHIALFPAWYATRASDWPALDAVGFPLPLAEGFLPRHIRQLIADHGRPLVFTPGTAVRDVSSFFEQARRCCERLGLPGVLLSPHHDARQLTPGGPIVHADFVDLASLLPHTRLLVHHGGIGTTARALEAGIPQIISPQAFDQPDNGQRVADLGIGAVLDRSSLTGETLAAAAAALLGSAEVARRLRSIARRMTSESGIDRAADILVARFSAPGRVLTIAPPGSQPAHGTLRCSQRQRLTEREEARPLAELRPGEGLT
ncbi:MAG: glycosyltransferase [Polyangiaceae bacterium]